MLLKKMSVLSFFEKKLHNNVMGSYTIKRGKCQRLEFETSSNVE